MPKVRVKGQGPVTPAADKAKQKRVDAAIAAVRKAFGKSALVPITELAQQAEECVSTNIRELDDILTGDVDKNNNTVPNSGRGLPRGRIVELFGPESSGKTTLTLELIKAFQEQGLVCAFIDAEHALDLNYAAKLGVNLNALLFEQPMSAEDGLGIATTLADSGGVDLIVIDSVSALTPKAELEKNTVGKPGLGLQARLMSETLRKLAGKAKRSGTTIIFINQIRLKIGVMFGNPETTSGGNSLKFYASIRLAIRKTKTLKKGAKKIGIRSSIETVKNKTASPFRKIHVEMKRGKGITDVVGEFEDEGGGDE